MGVDILNPPEPPKKGDINLKKNIEQYGNRIGWEGNIEIQDIIQSEPERLRSLIDECVEAGTQADGLSCARRRALSSIRGRRKNISKI